MFPYLRFLFYELQLVGICHVVCFRKLVIVSAENLDYVREKHDVELGAGLYAGSAWEYQVSVMVFGFREIGGHEVRIRKAGVALDEEQIERDASCLGGRYVCAQGLEFFGGEDYTRFWLWPVLTDVCIRIALNVSE